MGALMGGGVGLTIGFIFGSWSIIRYAVSSSPTCLHSHHQDTALAPEGSWPLCRSICLVALLPSLSSSPSVRYASHSQCRTLSLTRRSQVIRSDSPLAVKMEAMQLQMAASNPILRSKVQSAQIVRARWAEERAARSNH